MDLATALRQGLPPMEALQAVGIEEEIPMTAVRVADDGSIMRFQDGSPIPDLSEAPTFGRRGFAEGAKEFLRQEAPTMASFLAGPALGAAGRAVAAHPGMSAALISALGLGAADAGTRLTRRQQREMEMERQRLDAQAEADRKRMQAETEATRQRAADQAQIESERQKRASEQGEYDRQVKLAEAARDKELERVRRFSDTGVGQIFDSMAGLAPFLAGMAGGGLSRLATGPGASVMGKILKDYVLPVATGTAAGFTAANAPLAYDAFYTDPDNPEKAAASAYARELPQGHPRKQEFANFAATLPDKNPVREQAGREFYDDFGKRLGMSLIEGGGGALMGSDAVRAGARKMFGGAPQTAPAPSKAGWQSLDRAPNGRWLPKAKKPSR